MAFDSISESVPEALSEPVSHETFIRVVAELSARISHLEALLTPKAMGGPAPGSFIPDRALYEMWQRGHDTEWDRRLAEVRIEQRAAVHRRFVPDYDSEGAY